MDTIAFRLFLTVVFSALIGYEREVSESHAGLKTHILVAIGATLIALLQSEVNSYVESIALINPEVSIPVSADASRLLSQVVSGIGFLGAGTIIVTKRNVSGLTTAASIWTVAGIGLSLGMGFYSLATIGFVFVFLTLSVIKRLPVFTKSHRIIVRYTEGAETLENIKNVMLDLDLDYELSSYRSELFSEYIIHENIFRVKDFDASKFQDLISKLSTTKNVVSVEKTNIK